MDRPNTKFGNTVCSKADEIFFPMLGGEYYEGCSYTKDQVNHLKKIYKEDCPTGNDNPLIEAGELRNVLRSAKVDGQRLIGVLAKYVENDEDPVKVLIRVLIDAGYDVDPENVDWVEED